MKIGDEDFLSFFLFFLSFFFRIIVDSPLCYHVNGEQVNLHGKVRQKCLEGFFE